jgi:hypothetical protein
MGTGTTKSKDRTLKISESMDESAEFDFKFNYMKNNSTQTQSLHQSETTENTKVPESNDLIPFKFEWKESGTDVKISGSFLDNWDRKEPLKFNNETKSYEITLNIPRGLNQFKFIVDDKWVCSKYYKVIKDKSNNDNNEIDTNAINESTMNSSMNNNNILDIKKTKKKVGKGNNDYNCLIPTKSAVNAEAPIIPLYFRSYINIDFNSNQLDKAKFNDKLLDLSEEKAKDTTKENEEMLILNKTKDLLETNTFKSIMTIPHEKLSHLFLYCDSDNKYIRNAMTQRNKHKFLTVVYFSPKK